jgi:hypothetical protein
VAQVYSVQLAAQALYHGQLQVLVPTGYKLVVRRIDAYSDTLGYQSNIKFRGNIIQPIWAYTWQPMTFGPANWDGRQVFEAGQSFYISCDPSSGGSLAQVNFQVSGYKLALP